MGTGSDLCKSLIYFKLILISILFYVLIDGFITVVNILEFMITAAFPS